MKSVVALTAASLLAFAAPSYASLELARAKNCMACHAVDRRMVGPSFRDIAARYAGQAGAVDRLTQKILRGSSGVWGPVPMPPSANVSEAEARQLATWTLTVR
jgi:cytochrome c